MLEMGTQLAKRSGDGPAAIVVVGVAGKRYVCQDIGDGDFGENLAFSPEELMLLYGALHPEIEELTEQEQWAKMSTTAYRASSNEARREEGERATLPSPEQTFAKSEQAREVAQAAESGFAAKVRRKA
jgi:hypothetical protein